MDLIKVVCGVIYKDGKIFICRRKPEKSLGGYWEFPGGKVENNEQPKDSLKRELREELHMKVEVEDYLMTNVHIYDNFTIELIAYRCSFIRSTFKLTDHDRFEWVFPEELQNWKFAPADIPISVQVGLG